MNKTMVGLMLTFALALAAPKAYAAEGHGHHSHSDKPQTSGQKKVQGEVLDMACYMGHDGKGAKHKKCAEACIKGGAPIGLLTKEGDVYLLVEDHSAKGPYESLKGQAAEEVKVTGDYYSRGGVQAIVVQKVEKTK